MTLEEWIIKYFGKWLTEQAIAELRVIVEKEDEDD